MPIGKIWAGDFFSAGRRLSILSIEIMEAPPKEMAWRPQIKSTLFICFYGMVLHVAGMSNRTINLRTCFVFIVVCYLVLFTVFTIFTVFRDVLITNVL